MEKSLLILLQEEDMCVEKCNVIKSQVKCWSEMAEQFAADNHAHLAKPYFARAKMCESTLAEAENELATAREHLRQYFRDILKAETA